MTFAFIERQAALPFADRGAEPAAIANPLSEKFAVLRPSLLPGLGRCGAHNRRRERRDVQLFETGSRFTAEGEGRAAAFVWSGAATPPHWSAAARAVDFFDVKGVAQQLVTAFGVETECVVATRSYLVPGRAAELVVRRNGRPGNSACSASSCRRSQRHADFRRTKRSTRPRSTSTRSPISSPPTT